MFHAVGIVTVGGEIRERKVYLPFDSIALALTEAVGIFDAMADEGTSHRGVWCYHGGPEEEDRAAL